MEQNQSTTPNLLRSRFFYTLRGIAIGLVILISGMCIGGGLTALYIWKHIEYVIHHTDEAAVRVSERMAKHLNLSDEQQDKVCLILQESLDKMQAIRVRVKPEVDAELDRADREIRAVLTDEQAQKWEKRFNEIRGLWQATVPNEPS